MSLKTKYPHYYKQSPTESVDVYRVLRMFNVRDPAIAHAVKKLLAAGKRTEVKDASKDIQEAIDSLQRYQEMDNEDLAMIDLNVQRREEADAQREAREANPMISITAENLTQAIGLAYTTKANKKKVVDPTLAKAIVQAALRIGMKAPS